MGEARTFSHPKSWRWRFFISTPVWIFGSLGMVYVSLVQRSPFALILVPVGLYGVLHVGAKWLLFASSIKTSDEGLVARRYIGLAKCIDWSDVGAVQHLTGFWFDGRKLIRVTDAAQGGSIVFTDAISDFSELLAVVDGGAPSARRMRLPRYWRLILG